MSEILKLLEENIGEYGAQLENAEQYLQENEEKFASGYAYVQRLKMPVKKNQFFFYCDPAQPGANLIRTLYENLSGKALEGAAFLYYGKKPGENCEKVKENTNKYWAALARSGYVISNTSLPEIYVKREGQIYFNSMFSSFRSKEIVNSEMVSGLSREFLKTDLTLAPNEKTARAVWEKKTGLLGLYQGKILLCGKPVGNAAVISEILLALGRGESIDPFLTQEVGVLAGAESPDQAQERKKILVLTSWKAPREQKYVIRYVLSLLAASQCDVTILSPMAEKTSQLLDFARLPGRPAAMMYAGSFPMDREEILASRIVERNPQAYRDIPEIRDFLDGLMKRAWVWIWGSTVTFDACVVLGAQGWQSYYLVMNGNFRKRVLADLDYLEKTREKEPEEWNRVAAAFDEIICMPGGKDPEAYGEENKGHVRHLSVEKCKENASLALSARASSAARAGEILKLDGREYVVCDAWRAKDGWNLTLLELPAPGAVLRRDSFCADEQLWKHLFLLPAAEAFFARLGGCVRNPLLEYDAAAEICGAWGVPILSPEKGKETSPS